MGDAANILKEKTRSCLTRSENSSCLTLEPPQVSPAAEVHETTG